MFDLGLIRDHIAANIRIIRQFALVHYLKQLVDI